MEKIIPLEEPLTQLQQLTGINLAKLKAESEETIVARVAIVGALAELTARQEGEKLILKEMCRC